MKEENEGRQRRKEKNERRKERREIGREEGRGVHIEGKEGRV